MVRTDLKGRIELGVEGLDVLASLALRTRTFSPGLVTPLRLYLPYRKKNRTCVSGTQRGVPVTAQSKVLDTSRYLPTQVG